MTIVNYVALNLEFLVGYPAAGRILSRVVDRDRDSCRLSSWYVGGRLAIVGLDIRSVVGSSVLGAVRLCSDGSRTRDASLDLDLRNRGKPDPAGR